MELFLPQDRHPNSAFGGRVIDQRILSTLIYHDIFGYPLTQSELIKWEAGKKIKIKKLHNIKFKNNYYFLEGRDGLIFKRLMHERISQKKMKIATRASKVLSKIPTAKLVAITGSLSMKNANENSDIDLMIVTSGNSLWLTRIISYLLLKSFNFKLRSAGDKSERDKLCLNIWMDERDLVIEKHNVYTAHELAQIVPLVNKNKTYEKLIEINSWVKAYWPNAVKINKTIIEKQNNSNWVLKILEQIAFRFQYNFMKNKITREVITPTRAFFHPYDWGKFISSQGF